LAQKARNNGSKVKNVKGYGVLMQCSTCKAWILRRRKFYGDGTEIFYDQAPEGQGHCEFLNALTAADFGCNKFQPDDNIPAHTATIKLNGAPWQNWHMGPCPDCRGNGNQGGACWRCAGTSNVRYYDDGYVGEERTRRHPNEGKAPDPVVDPGTIIQPLPVDVISGPNGTV
jgi:hypothetical protein